MATTTERAAPPEGAADRARREPRAESPDRSRVRAGSVRSFAGTRVRLLAGFAVLTAASIGLSLLLVHQILSSRLEEDVARSLAQEIDEFRRLSQGVDPRTGEPFGTDIRRLFGVYFSRNVPDEGEVLVSAAGRRLYRAARAGDGDYRPGEVLRLVALQGGLATSSSGSVETSAGTARYVSVPLRFGGDVLGAFVVANFPESEQREIDDAVVVAAQVSAVVLLLAFAVAWLAAGRVLAPLRLLRETAHAITETDLTRRIPIESDDEVARLAETFNEMLDRLEAAFATQRQFLDDVGHELRTPITIVRGHLELLSDDPEERRQTLALVDDELERMARLVSDLLTIAKAERPDFLTLEPIELESLTEEAHSKLRALGRRGWRLESVGRGSLLADRHRLTQALVQLAENAVKATGDGDEIWLGTFVADGEARLWVRDSGPGIPYEEQGAIFERLEQGSAARGVGTGLGLGLSIVQAIARAHGGRVEIRSRPGAGATFTVVVPVAGPGGPR